MKDNNITEIYEGFGERIWPIQSTRKPRNRKIIMSKRNKLLAIKHNRIKSKLPDENETQGFINLCIPKSVSHTCSKCGRELQETVSQEKLVPVITIRE